MNNPIKIMVIDDSILFRNWLIKNLEKDLRFQVVGWASNAFDAMAKLPAYKPDVLTLDIEMPGMTGLEFLKKLFPLHPIPVILVSSLNMGVFDALNAGAVDFVRKPDEAPQAKEEFLKALTAKLIIASRSHVRLPSSTSSSFPSSAEAPSAKQTLSVKSSNQLIAIGASTGGTEAILEVVRQFPADMPGVVITQHMPAGFTAMYAERLNRLCRMEAKEAKDGDRVRRGLILLAPGGLQMRVVRLGDGYAVHCTKDERVNGHCPSVDVLFDSVALTARQNAIGILLTGMGADGAAGLLRMRKNGAYTIGQDKATCVVYGMPMEAYKIGAVCLQSPLSSIPQAVFRQLSASSGR